MTDGSAPAANGRGSAPAVSGATRTGVEREELPMIWPIARISHRGTAAAIDMAADGFPTVCDGDMLAILKGDLTRIVRGVTL